VSSPSTIPAGAALNLNVVRGQNPGTTYPIKQGKTILGRAAAAEQLPVDVDMDNLERPGQIFAANHHAIITFANGNLTVEDTGTANGTYLNRAKLPPNSPQPLKPDDVVQIGTVKLQVKVNS
jgi:pSer/pThr/pTyr-binding forkhead associated (FHA) protein